MESKRYEAPQVVEYGHVGDLVLSPLPLDSLISDLCLDKGIDCHVEH